MLPRRQLRTGTTASVAPPHVPRVTRSAGSRTAPPAPMVQPCSARRNGLPDCRPLLADPDDLTLVFQPIVDLARATVAGYEALARFPGTAGPDVWFAAAAEAGVAAELEALAIHKALAAVPALPANTFLTVNVSPHLLGTAPVQDALATRPDLHRVVVELTEHTPVDDLAAPAPADRRAARPRRAHRPGRRRQRLLGPAADGRPAPPGGQARPRPGRRRRHRPRARGAGRDGRRVRRPDRRLAARRGHRDRRRAGRVRAGSASRWPRAGCWAAPRPDFAPLAPEVAQLVRAQVARARLTESVASLLRPVRQASPGEDVAGRPAGRAGRTAGRADRPAAAAIRGPAEVYTRAGVAAGAPVDRHRRDPAARAHPAAGAALRPGRLHRPDRRRPRPPPRRGPRTAARTGR